MDPLMVALRILHIVFGVFWVGTIFFMVIVLEPRLRALGPAIRTPVMHALIPVMALFMMVSSLITIGSGVAIALVMWWGIYGWDMFSLFFTTGWGWAILIGFVASIAAFILGGSVTMAGRRIRSLAGIMAGSSPNPEEARQLERLSARIMVLSRTEFVLLLITVAAMAAARFV